MTPPVIDDRGFALGKVNVIDGFVVQLIAAIALVGVALVAPDHADVWATAIIASDLIALWGLSRAPEPTESSSAPDDTEAESAPADGANGDDNTPVVTVEVPSGVDVRVRRTARADGQDGESA